MASGKTLRPGAGERISVGELQVDVKVSAADSPTTSTFEVRVPPGFDVGAHRHQQAEELFYVLDGELDLLAFEPISYDGPNWRTWRSASGERTLRAGPGCLIYVPPGCPHAFANSGTAVATMLFQASPAGHEKYFQELAEIVARHGGPDPQSVAGLRERHGIEQLSDIAVPTR